MAKSHKRTRRRQPSADVVSEVLIRSRRRCCLCYQFDGDMAEKRGQIAHVDRDSGNNAADNLVFLCLTHHDELNRLPRGSKSLTAEEVKKARDALYRTLQVELFPAAKAYTPVAPEVPGQVAAAINLLEAIGDNDAVVQIGHLLIVKKHAMDRPGKLLIQVLTDSELEYVNANRHILSTPEEAMEAIGKLKVPSEHAGVG